LISYPLYLWHWPLLSFARILEGEEVSWGIRIAAIAASFLLAWLTYRLVERPIRFGEHDKIKSVSLCFLMVAIGFVGYCTYFRDGLVFGKKPSEVFAYDWKTGYRYPDCFIDGAWAPSKFAPYCSGDTATIPPRPLVFLWGDSHAASLYRGLSKRAKIAGFDLAQFTASGCPPIVDFSVENSKECKEINRFVIRNIEKLHPDTVILSAYWLMYNGEDKWDLLDYSKLQATIRLLREADIQNIVLFGQLPVFKSHQPEIGEKVFKTNRIDRTYKNFNSLSFEVNNKIKAVERLNGIPFVSPVDLLCNSDGCLISTSREVLSPLAWDYGHLTEEGSIFLIDMAIKKNQLKLPAPPIKQ